MDTMINRQEKRGRQSEKNVDKQYLIDIYNKYESMINYIYPNHIVIENENGFDYNNTFEQYFSK